MTVPTRRSFWNNLFLSPQETRLRAFWRLLIQSTALILLMTCLSVPLVIPVLLKQSGGRVLILGSTFVEFIGVTTTVYLARRLLDRRSFASLGFRFTPAAILDILAGLIIAGLVMGLIFLCLFSLGWLHFDGFAWQFEPPAQVLVNSLLAALLFLLVGWSEELLSRGYHLQTIASGLNRGWGVVLSSAVFGCLHLLNPGASWISTLGIFVAGLFLAFGYLRTGQLWLSIGLHIGWNFFEGPVFGFLVSGTDFYPISRVTVSGPVLWTGGAFGPEAGLIVLPAIAVGVGLIFLYSKMRGRLTPGPLIRPEADSGIDPA